MPKQTADTICDRFRLTLKISCLSSLPIGTGGLKQEAIVTGYTGSPKTPYAITEMNALGVSDENTWPGLTHKVEAETLDDRLVNTDGMTKEEKRVLNCRVVRTFNLPQTPATKEKKHRLRAQGDMRDRPTRKALTGGVVKVCANKTGTLNTIVYEDMRTENLTTRQLLERITFFEDPRRAQRLKELERQASAARDWPLVGPVRTAAQKRARRSSKRGANRSFFKRANRGPCNTFNTTEHSEGFLPPTGWSWTRPGIYPDAVPLTPAPQTVRTGRPAGPGLPDGDATGDDD